MVVQPCRIARCATGSFRSIQPFFFSHVLSFSFSHAHAHWSIRCSKHASSTDSWNLDIAPRPKALLPNCRDVTDPLFSLFTHTNWNWKRWADPSIFPLMRFERDVGCCGCGLSNEIRNFGNFFSAIRWSFLYYNFLDLFEMVSTRWFVEMLEMIAFQCGVWMCSRWDRLIRGYESFFRCVFIRNTSSYIRWR